jgi:hypothetical protein
MKTALAATCVLLLLAIGYLSLSLVVLKPPRANVRVWFALAAVPTTQSVLTHLSHPPTARQLRSSRQACPGRSSSTPC